MVSRIQMYSKINSIASRAFCKDLHEEFLGFRRGGNGGKRGQPGILHGYQKDWQHYFDLWI